MVVIKYYATELQNQSWGGDPVPGEFDSHTLPPVISKPPRFGGFFVCVLDGFLSNILSNILFLIVYFLLLIYCFQPVLS